MLDSAPATTTTAGCHPSFPCSPLQAGCCEEDRVQDPQRRRPSAATSPPPTLLSSPVSLFTVFDASKSSSSPPSMTSPLSPVSRSTATFAEMTESLPPAESAGPENPNRDTPSTVLPGLHVGGYYQAEDPDVLRRLNVHVILRMNAAKTDPLVESVTVTAGRSGKPTTAYESFPKEKFDALVAAGDLESELQGKEGPAVVAFRVNIAAVDTHCYSMRQHFAACNDLLDRVWCELGHNMLVHCTAGASRAPAVVIAYLMWKYKLTAFRARDAVRARRDIVGPNSGFMRQLREYETDDLMGSFLVTY